MNIKFLLLALFLTFIYPACSLNAQGNATSGSTLSDLKKKEIEKNIRNLSPGFRKNLGQWDDNILFESGTSGIHMYFMKDGISFASVREVENNTKNRSAHKINAAGDKHEYLVWNMKFLGCNKKIKYTSEGERKSKINYLIGNDPSRFVTSTPDYNAIQYHDLYDKIDLRYYSSGNKIEYDYIVKPGGRPDQIKMNFEGIKKVKVKKDGVLEIKTEWGSTTDLAPYSYQVINGVKKQVNVRYYLVDDTTVGFDCQSDIDPANDLIIDPVILYYSTYVGATQASSDGLTPWGYIFDIEADSQGNAYVTGWYDGTGFPTKAGNYDASYNLATDVFVFKLNPTGTNIIFGTYVGGNQKDEGNGINIDTQGNVYVTGQTASPNFPTTAGAFDVSYNGVAEAFVLKLNPTGTTLIYSTYLGATSTRGSGIVVNGAGEAFISGTTADPAFPVTAGCYDNTFNGGPSDIFVTKLNAGGSAVLYSTYIGGSADTGTGSNGNYGASEIGYRIRLDGPGDVYVTGWSTANNFPTTAGCFDPTYNGSTPPDADAIVFKLSPNGGGATDLKYSTYLGGAYGEIANDIGVNAAGEAFVTGASSSNNFPTTPASYDPSYNGPVTSGPSNPFVVRLNSAGSALVYSTFLGFGGGLEYGMSIRVNSKNQAYVAVPYPTNVPMTSCSYKNIKTGTNVALLKLNSSGSNLLWTGLIGGSGIDADFSTTHIALVENGCNESLIMTNTTHSHDFPVTPGAFQTGFAGAQDQPAVSRFTQTFDANFTLPSAACNVSAGFINTSNQCGLWDSVQTWLWDFGDGTTSNLLSPSHTYTAPGTYTVKLIAFCPDDTVSKILTVTGVCGMSVTATPASVCQSSCATVTAMGNGGSTPYTYSWNTGANTQNISPCPGSTTTYTVKITDSGGTTATTTVMVTVNPGVNITATPTDITCNGNANGSVTVNPASGSSPFTYNWSNGQNTQTATGLPAGNYTVTVTDSKNCTTSVSAAIISPPPLSGLFVKGTATCTSCGCKEWIMVTSTGGTSPYSYSWPDGYMNRYKNQLCPGAYTVNIADKNGCNINVSLTAP
ncbi:MAG: SBBP repeat-containing protein [Bacteroidetes bacterium]|nr:SBBP repeat-containing protein [Bacteroidota bacterium]